MYNSNSPTNALLILIHAYTDPDNDPSYYTIPGLDARLESEE